MENVLKSTKIDSQIPKNWEKKESIVTADDVIDAYFKGKKDGMNEVHTIVVKQFQANLKRATSIAEKFMSEAEKGKNKIDLKTIHLRADSISSFSFLFIAAKKDFISDKFRDIYIKARELKNKEEKQDFFLNFSFMPYSKNINEGCIKSDGYFLKYVKGRS